MGEAVSTQSHHVECEKLLSLVVLFGIRTFKSICIGRLDFISRLLENEVLAIHAGSYRWTIGHNLLIEIDSVKQKSV